MDWSTLPPLIDMATFGRLVPAIGKNKRYELVRQKGFPAKKLGNKILIHRDGLKQWLDREFGLVDEEPAGKLRLIK
jgi:excisionase family DNA binding protein